MDWLEGLGWAGVIAVGSCLIWDLFLPLNLLIIGVVYIKPYWLAIPSKKDNNFLSIMRGFSGLFCKFCLDNMRSYIEGSGILLPPMVSLKCTFSRI